MARLLAVFFVITASPPADTPDGVALVESLLELPAPSPDWRAHLKDRLARGEELPRFPTEIETPPDDAPTAQLVAFWKKIPTGILHRTATPTPTVADRLLAAVTADPTLAPDLVDHILSALPDDDPDAHDKAKTTYDATVSKAETEPEISAAAQLRTWLMFHSKYFRAELEETSVNLHLHTLTEGEEHKIGDKVLVGNEELEALAKLDWKAAEPLLLRFAEDSAQRAVQAFALGLLLEHRENISPDARAAEALAKGWCRQLVSISADKTTPGNVRRRATDILMEYPWDGQVGHFQSLLDDDASNWNSDEDWNGPFQVIGFLGHVRSDPDRWIPLVAEKVNDPSRTVHNNAVRSLAQFNLEDARPDALRPLLPWLGDPDWANDSSNDRLRLIQSLDQVDLPECVPGLLWAVEHGEGYEVSAGAESLAHYRAKEAVPILRKAVARTDDVYHRRRIISVLHALGGITTEEIVASIVSYAEKASNKEGRAELKGYVTQHLGEPKHTPPFPLAIGLHFQSRIADVDLAEAILASASSIAEKRPEVAAVLHAITANSDTETAAIQFAARLRSGNASAEDIANALETPEKFAATLAKTAGLTGTSRGVKAALLGDPKASEKIFASDDSLAKSAFLASARFRRLHLDVVQVVPFLNSKNTLLASAAESYLTDLDTRESRSALPVKFPGEARILGAGAGRWFGKFEDQLRQRVLAKNGPDEIIALFSWGTWGDNGQRTITISGESIAFTHGMGGGRFRTGKIDPAAIAELKKFLDKYDVEDLPPYTPEIHDGVQYQYVRVTADDGRRIFMNNPPMRSNRFSRVEMGNARSGPSADIYGLLVEKILHIADDAELAVRYRSEEGTEGFEIAVASEDAHIKAVTSNTDGKIHVLVSRGSWPDRSSSWYALTRGKLSPAPSDPPPPHAPGNAKRTFPPGFRFDDHLLSAPWRSAVKGGIVNPARKEGEPGGLWLCQDVKPPTLLAKGWFANPVAIPGGDWVVAARTDGISWAQPNSVFRIHIPTKEMSRIDVPAADNFQAVTYISAHEKILLHRWRNRAAPGVAPDSGPEHAEYRLLDPATGESEFVEGDFRPFFHESWRPLQPTGNPHEVWAALPEKETTQIVRYDTRDFSFSIARTVPGIQFSSMDLWMAKEPSGTFRAYVTLNGDLLTFPLEH